MAKLVPNLEKSVIVFNSESLSSLMKRWLLVMENNQKKSTNSLCNNDRKPMTFRQGTLFLSFIEVQYSIDQFR